LTTPGKSYGSIGVEKKSENLRGARFGQRRLPMLNPDRSNAFHFDCSEVSLSSRRVALFQEEIVRNLMQLAEGCRGIAALTQRSAMLNR
jgi:hypothetical protein